MQHTAALEAERIEIVQDFWVRDGRISEPMADQVARRDDFAGIVRLIDLIQSDQVVMERIQRRKHDIETADVAEAAEKAKTAIEGEGVDE